LLDAARRERSRILAMRAAPTGRVERRQATPMDRLADRIRFARTAVDRHRVAHIDLHSKIGEGRRRKFNGAGRKQQFELLTGPRSRGAENGYKGDREAEFLPLKK